MSHYPNPSNYHRLLLELGFNDDPFDKTNADEENHLDKYFIQPPFFPAVLGQPAHPKSVVVFAPRGGGKTAMRKKIEFASYNHRFLCVPYNAPASHDCTLSEIGLSFHLRNILCLALVRTLLHIKDRGAAYLESNDKVFLALLAQQYLCSTDMHGVKPAVQYLRGLDDRVIDTWNALVGPIGLALNLALAKVGLLGVDVQAVRRRQINLGSPSDQLRLLAQIIKKLGYSSIYVLIDKVDETDLSSTGSTAYTYISPLLTNVQVLETPNVAFKLFLWDKLYDDYVRSARADRVKVFRLAWHNDQLLMMLEQRLKAFSNNQITSLTDLLGSHPLANLDKIVVYMSSGSPRTVIRMCKAVIDHQSNEPSQPSEIGSSRKFISIDAVAKGVATFAEDFARETIDEHTLMELRRLQSVSFTVRDVATKWFKISTAAARKKLDQWVEEGILIRAGSVREAKRPSQQYVFQHPLVAYAAIGSLAPQSFVESKLRICRNTECGNLLVRDWDEKEEIICHKCAEEYRRTNGVHGP